MARRKDGLSILYRPRAADQHFKRRVPTPVDQAAAHVTLSRADSNQPTGHFPRAMHHRSIRVAGYPRSSSAITAIAREPQAFLQSLSIYELLLRGFCLILSIEFRKPSVKIRLATALVLLLPSPFVLAISL